MLGRICHGVVTVVKLAGGTCFDSVKQHALARFAKATKKFARQNFSLGFKWRPLEAHAKKGKLVLDERLCHMLYVQDTCFMKRPAIRNLLAPDRNNRLLQCRLIEQQHDSFFVRTSK